MQSIYPILSYLCVYPMYHMQPHDSSSAPDLLSTGDTKLGFSTGVICTADPEDPWKGGKWLHSHGGNLGKT